MTDTGDLAAAVSDLEWLAQRDALAGVAAIIRERRRLIEADAPPPGEYEAESALDFGESAKAGALIAAGIDRDGE